MGFSSLPLASLNFCLFFRLFFFLGYYKPFFLYSFNISYRLIFSVSLFFLLCISISVILLSRTKPFHHSPNQRPKLTLNRNTNNLHSPTTPPSTKPLRLDEPITPNQPSPTPTSPQPNPTDHHAREHPPRPHSLTHHQPILTSPRQIKNAQSALLSNHELLLHLRAEEAEYTGTDGTSRNRKKPTGLNHMLRDVRATLVSHAFPDDSLSLPPFSLFSLLLILTHPPTGPRIPRNPRLHNRHPRIHAPLAAPHALRRPALLVPCARAKIPLEQGRVPAAVQPAAVDAGDAGAGD